MGCIRGYAGFYNGHYIRGSYEYVMTKILLEKNDLYIYEDETYYLKTLNAYYKPDFTIYDKYLDIVKIIEVKSGMEIELIKAYEKANAMTKEYGIKVEIYTLEELKNEANYLGLNVNHMIHDWINKYSTTNSSHVCNGDNNPMYGNKHSCETKKLLSEKSKKLWQEKREYIIRRTKEGMSNVDMKTIVANSNRHFAEYEERVCKYCNNKFKVNKISNKKFCDLQCANKYNLPNMPKKVSNLPTDFIVEEINSIAIKNKTVVLETPLNRITNTINLLFGDLMEQYEIKDERTLINQYLGHKGYRKEFIKALKEYLENVC